MEASAAGRRTSPRHLMKSENERVEIHGLRGFLADDLHGAFRESYAQSRATKCKQHLFSCSFSPPKDVNLDNAAFERAIAQIEQKHGLAGQPRAIVFHEKRGDDGELRRHAHAVWCRIKADEGKAVHLDHSKRKLNDVSRDLFLEHGWKLPRGYERHDARDPATYSLAEWQQSKRTGRDPKKTKEIFKDAWAMSDSAGGLAAALKEHGFILARGDRRGFVAMDHQGEAYAITRFCDVKAKDARARLGDGSNLPSATEAHEEALARVKARLRHLFAQEKQKSKDRLHQIEKERKRQAETARIAEQRLRVAQVERARAEDKERSGRVRGGFLGLVDWITGRRKKLEAQNQMDAEQSRLRDIQELKHLALQHAKEKRETERKRHQEIKDAKTKLLTLLEDVRSLRANEQPADKRDRAQPPARGRSQQLSRTAVASGVQSKTRQDFDQARSSVEMQPKTDELPSRRDEFKAKRRLSSTCPRRHTRKRQAPTLDR